MEKYIYLPKQINVQLQRRRDIGTAQSKSGAPRLRSTSFLIEPHQYPVPHGELNNPPTISIQIVKTERKRSEIQQQSILPLRIKQEFRRTKRSIRQIEKHNSELGKALSFLGLMQKKQN
uniref:Uncharacterized protein n=1 Tax=Oryza brachyantha TaxID=4533 RepID=J3M1K2_ORYBR